jgi:F0F1-type ATP synthase membrane subunit c/vacuolar-type H+-ATPase subunit K
LVGKGVAVAVGDGVAVGRDVAVGVAVAVTSPGVGVSVVSTGDVAWRTRNVLGTLVIPPVVGTGLAVGVELGSAVPSVSRTEERFSVGPAAYDVKHPASTKRISKIKAAPIARRR